MPRGHEHDLIYSLSIRTHAFWANFSGIAMGKKDRCAVFGCNNEHLFPKKYTVKFFFCPKSARKY